MSGVAGALELLVTTCVRDLHRKTHDGRRQIDSLHDALCSAGLIPRRIGQQLTSLADRYYDVFNAAVANSFGSWICDYVEEVCADQHLASHDPTEAQLLDGQFVKEWCQSVLRESQEQLQSALQTDAQLAAYITVQLQRELSKANVLVSVLNALGRIYGVAGKTGHGPSAATGTEMSAVSNRDRGVSAELASSQQHQQALQLLAWCARHRLHEAPHTGHYASMPEWMRRVQGRREKRPGRTLFLDDMLQELFISGAYPFSSLSNTLFTLGCAVRDSSPRSYLARLALLAYYLADLGLLHERTPAGRALLEDFRATFNLPAPLLASWQAALLLDTATTPASHPQGSSGAAGIAAAGSAGRGVLSQGGEEDEALSRACDLLVANAHGSLPIKFIETLVALGKPDVALVVHRAHAGTGCEGALTADQACALVDLRLRCGLLPEALQLARTYAAAQPDAAARHAALSRLVAGIASWALAAQQQESQASGHHHHNWARTTLLELCFSAEEEEVLVAWLAAQLDAGAPAGDVLPLLLASRWRVPETLGAFKRWADRQAQAGGMLGGIPAALAPLVDALMDTQVSLLPLPTRNVVLDEGKPVPNRALPPGAAGAAQGLVLTTDAGTPCMAASFVRTADGGCCAPPFVTTRIPEAPALAATGTAASDGPSAHAEAPHAGSAVGWVGAAPAAAPALPFSSMFTSMTPAEPVRPGPLAVAPVGITGPLFSSGFGAGVSTDSQLQPVGGGNLFAAMQPPTASDVRLMKRPRLGQVYL